MTNNIDSKKLISTIKNSYGINFARAKKICATYGFSYIAPKGLYEKLPFTYFFNLENNKSSANILKYKKIKNYRGIRHILKLPVRGQRTHTNANTIKKTNA
jgi:small subunit ribosomal protein S13